MLEPTLDAGVAAGGGKVAGEVGGEIGQGDTGPGDHPGPPGGPAALEQLVGPVDLGRPVLRLEIITVLGLGDLRRSRGTGLSRPRGWPRATAGAGEGSPGSGGIPSSRRSSAAVYASAEPTTNRPETGGRATPDRPTAVSSTTRASSRNFRDSEPGQVPGAVVEPLGGGERLGRRGRRPIPVGPVPGRPRPDVASTRRAGPRSRRPGRRAPGLASPGRGASTTHRSRDRGRAPRRRPAGPRPRGATPRRGASSNSASRSEPSGSNVLACATAPSISRRATS